MNQQEVTARISFHQGLESYHKRQKEILEEMLKQIEEEEI